MEDPGEARQATYCTGLSLVSQSPFRYTGSKQTLALLCMASAAPSSQSSAGRKGTPSGKYYQGDNSGSLKGDPRYRKIEEEEALRFLQTKDADWFSKNYTGQTAPSGYLIDKNGKETNTLPSQAITNGIEEVEAAARKRFASTYPDAQPSPEEPKSATDPTQRPPLVKSAQDGMNEMQGFGEQTRAEAEAAYGTKEGSASRRLAQPAPSTTTSQQAENLQRFLTPKQRKDWAEAQKEHQGGMDDWGADTDRGMKEQRERGRRFSPEEAKERFNQYKQEREAKNDPSSKALNSSNPSFKKPSQLRNGGSFSGRPEASPSSSDQNSSQPSEGQQPSVLDLPNNSRNKSFTDRQREGADRLAQFLQPGGNATAGSGDYLSEGPQDRPPGDPDRKKASAFDLAVRTAELARDQQRSAKIKDARTRGEREAQIQKDAKKLMDDGLHTAGVSKGQLLELGERISTLMAAGTGIGLVLAAPKANITAANRYVNSRILYFGYRSPEERAKNPGTKYLDMIDVMIAFIVNLIATWYMLPVIGVILVIILVVAVAVVASQFGSILGPIITSQLGL